ncbi:MAG TPA: peroxiredoxin [Firmicutes bacterium]|nr:peroxiredoxin [Bacillota bacterium]
MKIGSKFPTLVVQTTQGQINLPGDYTGKWLVLFSHPADFTPVCTTEFVSFQTLLPEFEKRNAKLLGLSVEQVQSHLKWIEWIKQKLDVAITFPIIADSLGHVATKLEMIGDNATSTVRNVFIICPNGNIRAILTYPKEVGRNIFEIIRLLDALQLSDKEKVALPANWPNNQLIGNKLIVPPPGTVSEINKREEEEANDAIACFDWWFCYKNMPNKK